MWEYRLRKNPIIDEEGWEIEKLHKMLESAGIEHVYRYRDEFHYLAGREIELDPGYQIIIEECGKRIISVVEGFGSYGFEVNRLEIMGLLTDEELDADSVVGWLSAENVFDRIKEYFENGKRNYR